ncbi:hypothetical protein SNEBB_001625 [Seison nebaliae]|nr:hypothetical protein SNEBB_001625 [Seison nebaliae]
MSKENNEEIISINTTANQYRQLYYPHLSSDSDHLNHGSFGMQPKQVIDKHLDHLRISLTNPDVYYRTNYLKFLDDSRRAVGKYMKVKDENLVLTLSTTTAFNTVLNSIEFQKGDIIVGTNYSYPAIISGIKNFAKKHELEYKEMEVKFEPNNPKRILEDIENFLSKSKKVKLFLIDHVNLFTTQIFPFVQIGDMMKKKFGVEYIFLDSAHSVPFADLSQIEHSQIDFCAGALFKWLSAPLGSAFLWVKECHHKFIIPITPSWGMMYRNEHENELDKQNIASEAMQKNFLYCDGTKSYANLIAVRTAIQIMEEQGIEEWKKHSKKLRRNLQAYMLKKWFPDNWKNKIINNKSTEHLFTFLLVELPPLKDYEPTMASTEKLRENFSLEHGIECCPLPIEGKIYNRFSLTIYNRFDDYLKFIDLVMKMKI